MWLTGSYRLKQGSCISLAQERVQIQNLKYMSLSNNGIVGKLQTEFWSGTISTYSSRSLFLDLSYLWCPKYVPSSITSLYHSLEIMCHRKQAIRDNLFSFPAGIHAHFCCTRQILSTWGPFKMWPQWTSLPLLLPNTLLLTLGSHSFSSQVLRSLLFNFNLAYSYSHFV
jgi:hypothetical protein